jgi:hypothetical protein
MGNRGGVGKGEEAVIGGARGVCTVGIESLRFSFRHFMFFFLVSKQKPTCYSAISFLIRM